MLLRLRSGAEVALEDAVVGVGRDGREALHCVGRQRLQLLVVVERAVWGSVERLEP